MSLRLDHDAAGFRVRVTGDRGKKNVDVTAQTYDEVIRSVAHYYLMHPQPFDRLTCPLCRAMDAPRLGPRRPRRHTKREASQA